MQTGWQTVDSALYYFEDNGHGKTSGTLTKDGHTYEFFFSGYGRAQDVSNLAAAKYRVGDRIRIASTATTETDGQRFGYYYHDWTGVVEGVAYNSNQRVWEYVVRYSNGSASYRVRESDLVDLPVAKYKVGDTLQIADGAIDENGQAVSVKSGTTGVVQSVNAQNYQRQAWSYTLKTKDGQTVTVMESGVQVPVATNNPKPDDNQNKPDQQPQPQQPSTGFFGTIWNAFGKTVDGFIGSFGRY